MNSERLGRVTTLLLLLATPVSADRIITVGFENNNIDATIRSEIRASSTGTPTIVSSPSPVHSGTYSLEINPSASTESGRAGLSTGVTSGTFWTRFYIYFTALPPSGTGRIYASTDGAVLTDNHVLTVSSTGTLVLTNTPTSATITATTTIATGQWYAIGIRHVVSNTVGELELQVNCSSEGTPLTATDTLGTDVGITVLGTFVNATYTAYFDDLVVNDSQTNDSAAFQTWSACPANLYMLEPFSDNTVTWTKTGANCSGTTNTDCVDDEPGTPDDLSGYNATSVNGNEDRLNSTTFSGGPDADDDIITLYAKARTGGSSASGTNTMRLLLWDQTGAQTLGPTTSGCDVNGWRDPTDSSLSHTHISFDAGTRTKANIESFDWGYEPVSVAQNCRVTALWAMVEWASYTPASCIVGLNLPLLGVGGCP